VLRFNIKLILCFAVSDRKLRKLFRSKKSNNNKEGHDLIYTEVVTLYRVCHDILYRVCHGYFVQSLSRYFVQSLSRYFVQSLSRYFVQSLSRYFLRIVLY
jgi:hypothetical protein